MFGDLWEREERELTRDISEHVKLSTTIRTEQEFVDKINTLVKQGDLLRLAESEKWDAIWKSFIFDMKKGTMKFKLNSITNTLPTGNNLLQ